MRGLGKDVTWAALLSLHLLVLGGCRPAFVGPEPEITDGVWVGRGGPDVFAFEFWEMDGEYGGVIHSLRDGKKFSEVPMTRVRVEPPEVELTAATGAVFRGIHAIEDRTIEGTLFYGDEEGPEMPLHWVDPAEVPGLRAWVGSGESEDGYSYARPATLEDGWVVGTPEDVDIDPDGIRRFVEAIIDGEAGDLHSVLVARDGRLVVEEYLHGWERSDLHQLASTTKSISSLLVGIAGDRGEIVSVQAPLLDFFTEEASDAAPGWGALRLEHLLTMSMGLDWTEEESQGVHGTGPAFFRMVLSRQVREAPGTRWQYVNANVNLLSGVIRHATGMHADDFALRYLFAPLGISRYDWGGMKTTGYPLMDGALWLRPRDMAKIGALVLGGGEWLGRRVVSEEWIRASTRPHMETGVQPEGYGYLWWVGRVSAPNGSSYAAILASGWGSQFIMVFPDLQMVVVTTGGNQDNGKHLAIGPVLMRTLLPGVHAR